MSGRNENGDTPVYATRGLIDLLLERAAATEPAQMNVVLDATPAGDFETDLGVDPSTPVLSHVYFPTAGRAVSDVFGVDLGTPAGRGRARFLTHPQGPAELTRRDDLAGVVLLAVPPWERITAFDRRGRELSLTILDAEPPAESLPE
ncbi:hypothetical protein [Haloplanus aerogenes]|uniref:Proteasome lid subunit RPN8/RPN11 n=1 Tax=Haloplanus aerogenes TaxID=660522 RepID=A0A3M0DU02_9EURY|nr:hypothetical protein [Haloplanus aerogenes]RMB25608.1 hypothetical protein ATH50_0705 [Haloplanus aerogenes]